MIIEKDLLPTTGMLQELLTEDELKEVAALSGLYDLYYKVSVAIVEYRKKNNMSQKDLAKILQVSQAMVSKLESGDYNYTIEQLWKVSRKIGIKFDIIFEVATASEVFVPIKEIGHLVETIPSFSIIEQEQDNYDEMGAAA